MSASYAGVEDSRHYGAQEGLSCLLIKKHNYYTRSTSDWRHAHAQPSSGTEARGREARERLNFRELCEAVWCHSVHVGSTVVSLVNNTVDNSASLRLAPVCTHLTHITTCHSPQIDVTLGYIRDMRGRVER
jgi:hypothetical protein